MNGVIAISQTKLTFGIIQILVSLLNFGMLFNFKSISTKQYLGDLILIMNSLVALIIAFEYIKTGGKYIQYVWMFTSVLYLVVLVIKKRKARSNNA